MPANPPDPAALFDLRDRVALVTGASSGLGARFVRVLAAAGATVVGTARRADRLAELAAGHAGVVPLTADLRRADDREAVVAATLERFGRLDILVNNAGSIIATPIERETLDDFVSTVELNLVAAWHLAKLAGAPMADQGRGSIVNIASIWGVVGAAPSRAAGYAASKGGLVNLTRELALQWARRGVRVNAICPGWIATEMNEALHDDPKALEQLRQLSPIPRFGRVDELDGPLLLLASDAGSFITGAVLMVDGGWTAR